MCWFLSSLAGWVDFLITLLSVPIAGSCRIFVSMASVESCGLIVLRKDHKTLIILFMKEFHFIKPSYAVLHNEKTPMINTSVYLESWGNF